MNSGLPTLNKITNIYKTKPLKNKWVLRFWTNSLYEGWYLLPTIKVYWFYSKAKYHYDYSFNLGFHFLIFSFVINKRSQ